MGYNTKWKTTHNDYLQRLISCCWKHLVGFPARYAVSVAAVTVAAGSQLAVRGGASSTVLPEAVKQCIVAIVTALYFFFAVVAVSTLHCMGNLLQHVQRRLGSTFRWMQMPSICQGFRSGPFPISDTVRNVAIRSDVKSTRAPQRLSSILRGPSSSH